jgi:phosphotransferase system HPr (HPr) family protein
VKNRLGLHTAPAVLIARIANKYPRIDVWVWNGDEQANGKSIMALMTLEARCNTELLFLAEGGSVDEQKALINELKNLFENKFFED